MNIETCKNYKAWLKYITKQDTEPYLENIDLDILHDNFCMMHYIKEHQVMDPFDYGVKRYNTEYVEEDVVVMDAAEADHVLGKAPSGVAIGDAYLASVVKGETFEEDPVEVENYWKGSSCAEQEVVDALAALRIGPP